MAFIGLCYPVIADLNSSGRYVNGVKASKAVSLEVSPQYTDTTEYNDINDLDPHREFQYADLTFSVTDETSIIIGKDEADDLDFYDTDSSDFYGFGVIRPLSDGTYSVLWLYKVQLWESDNSTDTKGENIDFATSEYAGKAYPAPDGKWKRRLKFDTKSDAVAWLENQANI